MNSSSGAWLAPDLARAKRLIAASGTKGKHVTVWWPKSVFSSRAIASYVVSLLERLGYRAQLKLVLADKYFPAIADSRSRPQIGTAYWGFDYPAAADFIDNLLSCRAYLPASPANQNLAEFCDPKLESQIKHALALDGSDPGAANLLWARIDRAIVDRAAWAPLFNPNQAWIVSKRLRNVQLTIYSGSPLFQQEWVR